MKATTIPDLTFHFFSQKDWRLSKKMDKAEGKCSEIYFLVKFSTDFMSLHGTITELL